METIRISLILATVFTLLVWFIIYLYTKEKNRLESFENSIPIHELVKEEKLKSIEELKKFYRYNIWMRKYNPGHFRIEEKKQLI